MQRRWLAVAVLAAFPFLGASGCGYNTIQTMDENAAAYRQQIEVQLQRRSDLIPNLVSTVQGFADQESAVLTEVTRARAGLQSALGREGGANLEELAQADAQVNTALGRFNSFVVEAYPQLRSNENFIRLQDELAGTENRIAVSRQDYNAAVQQYNAYIRRFPQTVTARVTGASARPYFEAQAGAETAPAVEFNRPGAPR